MSTPYGAQQDEFFMNEALKQARRAARTNEVPVGAIVVDENCTIIARGYNQTERRRTQAAHAEIIALTKAGKVRDDWRLNTCWLYVTLEPCATCMALIRMSRCAGVVYGASSPLFGYKGVDNASPFQLYKENVVEVVAGLCHETCADMLRSFFRAQRLKREKSCEKKYRQRS